MKKFILLLLLFSFIGVNATPKEVDVYKDQPTTIIKNLDSNVSVALVSANTVEKTFFKQYNVAAFFDNVSIQPFFISEKFKESFSLQSNYISVDIVKNIKLPLTNYCINQNLLEKNSAKKQYLKKQIKQRFKLSLFLCS